MNDELCHFGVKGMKWGVRRYQNKDGTLTKVGKRHYGSDTSDTSETAILKYKHKKVNQAINTMTSMQPKYERAIVNDRSN